MLRSLADFEHSWPVSSEGVTKAFHGYETHGVGCEMGETHHEVQRSNFLRVTTSRQTLEAML